MLKQLLIWNLPDRADMFRTIRHEGFHQFLDRIVEDAPVWFNEGMAEYYESAQRGADGRLQGGQIRYEHLRVLRDPDVTLVPLPKFVGFGAQQFYADAGPHYALAGTDWPAWDAAFARYVREAK